MTAAALLVVLGAALAMQVGGLSMAMGAFIAGVLLSESSFRHQLEADIEPFRGLLLGLFFLGVGMSLDLTLIARDWALILAAGRRASWRSRSPASTASRASSGSSIRTRSGCALLLAQGGEFAFVLYADGASASASSTRETDGAAQRRGHHLDGADAARAAHARATCCRSADALARRHRRRRRADRHGAGHRLRPLRPGGEPGAAVARHRRVDHRLRHGDDPGGGALRLQDLLRRRDAPRRAARRRRRQRQDRRRLHRRPRRRPTRSSPSSRPSSRSPGVLVRSYDRGHTLDLIARGRRLPDPRDVRVGDEVRRGGADRARRAGGGSRRNRSRACASATPSGCNCR